MLSSLHFDMQPSAPFFFLHLHVNITRQGMDTAQFNCHKAAMKLPLLGLCTMNRMDGRHAACIRTHRSETELPSDQPLFSNKYVAQIGNGNQEGLSENTILRENQRCTRSRAAISCLLSPRPKGAEATQHGDHNVLHVCCP